MKKICPYCGKEFETMSKQKQYCNLSCASKYNAQKRREIALKEWLETGQLNYGKNTMIKVNSVYREYINNQQNHKCAIYGIPDTWNGKKLIFVLDHIDGDSSNHNRNNLRLVCPNCDSQLETYKFKNRHSSSRDYRIFKDK